MILIFRNFSSLLTRVGKVSFVNPLRTKYNFMFFKAFNKSNLVNDGYSGWKYLFFQNLIFAMININNSTF